MQNWGSKLKMASRGYRDVRWKSDWAQILAQHTTNGHLLTFLGGFIVSYTIQRTLKKEAEHQPTHQVSLKLEA